MKYLLPKNETHEKASLFFLIDSSFNSACTKAIKTGVIFYEAHVFLCSIFSIEF